MTKEDLKVWVLSKGWAEDAYGHLRKNVAGRKDGQLRRYRFKLGKLTVRYEVQAIHEASQYAPRSTSWVRLQSSYYRNLSIDASGRLNGLRR